MEVFNNVLFGSRPCQSRCAHLNKAIISDRVKTGIAKCVTRDSAIIECNEFNKCCGCPTHVGVEFSKDLNFECAKKELACVETPFTVKLRCLEPKTAYFYRAFIIVCGIKYVGKTCVFVTENKCHEKDHKDCKKECKDCKHDKEWKKYKDFYGNDFALEGYEFEIER